MTDYSAFFIATQQASRALVAVAPATIDALLRDLADATVANTEFLLAENAKDLARMPATDPRYDRLRLTPERLHPTACS
jgi:glutamate-5-semialdehyde dehydrogenase